MRLTKTNVYVLQTLRTKPAKQIFAPDLQEALMAATRKKQDPAALDTISVAFVTFEHEESKRRCLEDYRYSRRGFCR